MIEERERGDAAALLIDGDVAPVCARATLLRVATDKAMPSASAPVVDLELIESA